MIEFLIGIFGAAVGFISGLLTPWIKWQIDKQKDRHDYRRKLVIDWRAAIDAERGDPFAPGSSFGSSAAYSSLRPHMQTDAIKKIEASRTVYVGGGRGDSMRKQMLLDEVARIEKQWKLV